MTFKQCKSTSIRLSVAAIAVGSLVNAHAMDEAIQLSKNAGCAAMYESMTKTYKKPEEVETFRKFQVIHTEIAKVLAGEEVARKKILGARAVLALVSSRITEEQLLEYYEKRMDSCNALPEELSPEMSAKLDAAIDRLDKK